MDTNYLIRDILLNVLSYIEAEDIVDNNNGERYIRHFIDKNWDDLEILDKNNKYGEDIQYIRTTIENSENYLIPSVSIQHSKLTDLFYFYCIRQQLIIENYKDVSDYELYVKIKDVVERDNEYREFILDFSNFKTMYERISFESGYFIYEIN
jgi:hypothetical protein